MTSSCSDGALCCFICSNKVTDPLGGGRLLTCKIFRTNITIIVALASYSRTTVCILVRHLGEAFLERIQISINRAMYDNINTNLSRATRFREISWVILNDTSTEFQRSSTESAFRHYSDVIMSAMVSQIIGVSMVCSTVCSGADQHQSAGVTGLCEGNSPVTGEFPSQRASNAEKLSIWWRHHGELHLTLLSAMCWWWSTIYRLRDAYVKDTVCVWDSSLKAQLFIF